MPTKKPTIKAILINDLHLSDKPPVGRVCTKDEWFKLMHKYLEGVQELATKYGAPILCAGDVFDRWNPTPELINFALRHLPNMFAVPGQHDLPNHQLHAMARTAYGCMVTAGKITDLREVYSFDDFDAYPLPWGGEIIRPPVGIRKPAVLVGHKFVWCGPGTGYPGAPENALASNIDLDRFVVAHFGDNHKPFDTTVDTGTGKCAVWNGGKFMARKRNERDTKPQVGLLIKQNKTWGVRPHILNDDGEEWLEIDTTDADTMAQLDMAEYIESMEILGEENAGSFKLALRRYLASHPPGPRTEKMILQAINND